MHTVKLQTDASRHVKKIIQLVNRLTKTGKEIRQTEGAVTCYFKYLLFRYLERPFCIFSVGLKLLRSLSKY